MDKKRALSLARRWAQGHKCSLRDGEAKEYHELFISLLEDTALGKPLPVLVNAEPDREYIDYICPRCKETISQRRQGQSMSTVYQCKYHDNCGQRVDWSSPQPYRIPPDGEKEI